MPDICKLCNQEKPLRYGHIMPAFAVRWLKRTSATGYLKTLKSNTRVQETKRVYLLCHDCEQLLAGDEKQFCERIFIPYHERVRESFEYGPWLKRFIVGLHWKVLVTKEDQYPVAAEGCFATAAQEWRSFLLSESTSHGSAELHLFLADVIDDATCTLPTKINWYLARGFDLTPMYSENGMAGVYAKVIKILTFSYLTKTKANEKYEGTRIEDEGVLTTGQIIEGQLGPFILGRARIIDRFPKTMSEQQMEKLFDKATQHPEEFVQSEGYRTWEADRKLKRTSDTGLGKKAKRIKGRHRNKPCFCGSGKKYKKCHGKQS